MSHASHQLRASLARNQSGSQAALCLAGGSAYAASAIAFPNFAVALIAVAVSLAVVGMLHIPAARRQQRFVNHILGQGKNWMTFEAAGTVQQRRRSLDWSGIFVGCRHPSAPCGLLEQ